MKLFVRLWRDQGGGMPIVSTILLYVILVLGMTVGLVTLRDQIVQEYGDLSVALDHLDQSWEVDGTGFTDSSTLVDPPHAEPAGLDVQNPPSDEGTPP